MRNLPFSFSTGDRNIDYILFSKYSYSNSCQRLLEMLLENMAYHIHKNIPANECIFPVLENFLKNATWGNEQVGDFNPDKPDPWLKPIASAYYCMYEKIHRLVQLYEEYPQQFEGITPEELLGTPFANDFWSLDPADLLHTYDELSVWVSSREYSPLEVVQTIHKHWHILYAHPSTYEALSFCVLTAVNCNESILQKLFIKKTALQLSKYYRDETMKIKPAEQR